MSTIKVIVCRVGAPPVVENIENTVEAMQAIVGGWFEGVKLESSIMLSINEEGRLRGLPFNRLVGSLAIVGDFFITGIKDAEDISLTDEQITRWMERLT